MKKGILAIALSLTALSQAAHASDISFYGGREFNDVQDQNTLAASLGIDIPTFLGPLSVNQIRADISYIFTNFDIPTNAFDDTLIVGDDGFLDTSVGTLTFHAGPGWRFDAFDRVAIFAAAQAGVAITQADVEFIGTPSPNVDTFTELTETNFSYQFPVGVEYGLSKRIGVTARYRGIGIAGGDINEFSHILEGGIVIRF